MRHFNFPPHVAGDERCSLFQASQVSVTFKSNHRFAVRRRARQYSCERASLLFEIGASSSRGYNSGLYFFVCLLYGAPFGSARIAKSGSHGGYLLAAANKRLSVTQRSATLACLCASANIQSQLAQLARSSWLDECGWAQEWKGREIMAVLSQIDACCQQTARALEKNNSLYFIR